MADKNTADIFTYSTYHSDQPPLGNSEAIFELMGVRGSVLVYLDYLAVS